MAVRATADRANGSSAAAVPTAPSAAVSAFMAQLIEDLAKGPLNLPCFPDIVPRVRKVLADPLSTPDDVVRIAGTEPRLAARLLQTANSAVFNPSGKSFGDLRQAVTRLGYHLVQSVTMAFAVQQMKTDSALRPVAEPLGDLWQRSIAVASICQVLADKLRVPGDKVFLTGLLHGIGYFYIMVRVATTNSGVRVEDLPADYLTSCHPAVGRSVLQKWGFEAGICDAILNQNDHQRVSKRAADISDVVIASVALADALLEHDGDLSRCEGIGAFASLGLSRDDLAAILKHTQYHLSSLRDTLGV